MQTLFYINFKSFILVRLRLKDLLTKKRRS